MEQKNIINDENQSINIINVKLERRKTFLTIEELSYELSMSRSTIFKMMKENKLIENYHYSKPGNGKILFYFDAIIELFKPSDFNSR